MLLIQFIVSALLVVATFTIHFVGLVALSALMRRRGHHPATLTTMVGQGASILSIVLTLFLLHAIEICVYAAAFRIVGAVETVETALYFSTSTFTTVGFGDIVLTPDWRLMAAAESMNGFLLIGWSTAFLVSVTGNVRAFEATVRELTD